MFNYEEKSNLKPSQLSKILNITPKKVSELANDLEKYNVVSFSKTPLGSFLFKESQIKIIKEYYLIKNTLGKTNISIDILKESDVIPLKKEDMSWAKMLNSAIWRRH